MRNKNKINHIDAPSISLQMNKLERSLLNYFKNGSYTNISEV